MAGSPVAPKTDCAAEYGKPLAAIWFSNPITFSRSGAHRYILSGGRNASDPNIKAYKLAGHVDVVDDKGQTLHVPLANVVHWEES